MAQNELRKMNRAELIEVIYELQQNEAALQAKIDDLQAQLDDKIIKIEEAGSIAEAALSLNNVFDDIQKAAEQYLLSLQHQVKNQLSNININITTNNLIGR